VAKTERGLEILQRLLDAEQLRPAIGTHTIYELAKLLWDQRTTAIRCRLFQALLDLDPAFLVPADQILQCELRRLQRGEPVVPFMMGADLDATKRVVARLAAGESDDEAIQFTRQREEAIDRTRQEDQLNVERLRTARNQGQFPLFRTFEQLVEYYRSDIPELIQRRFKGRIDLSDAQRFAARLNEFPALRTAVRADLHFMFIRAAQEKVPSRDKTADYRHVVDAAYCTAILIDDRKLFRKVPVLNPELRAIGWPTNQQDTGRQPSRVTAPTATSEAQTSRSTARALGRSANQRPRRRSDHSAPERTNDCIYCRSSAPTTKREHVMSQLLGTFEQNWTLDCVCDECNQYFADNLELPLGRDSREALFRIELGLKPAAGASELLNQRIKTSLQDPGQFDGLRVLIVPSDDGSDVVPEPVPQVSFRQEGEEWCFLIEKELTSERVERFRGSSPVEIRIHGVGPDCDRLRQRLADLGIEFAETHRALNQPITEQSSISVLYEIDNDETIVRAACKIGFNYAAKMLGCSTVRRPGFDAARRFVRYGEAPVRIATAQQLSVLVGPDAESATIHACALGWDRGYLMALVSLFNEVTYGLRLCEAGPTDFPSTRHFFDPLARTISEADIAG
jgi:hypothetical protein